MPKPVEILKSDRSGKIRDARGRFVSNAKIARSYYYDRSNRLRDPTKKVVDRDTRAKLETGAVLRRRDRAIERKRAKAVIDKLREIKARRKPEKIRAEIRKKHPKDRTKKPRRPVRVKAKPPRRRVSDWREKIKGILESYRDALGIAGTVHTARNPDGSVDGELRLTVPRKMPAREVIKTLSEIATIPEGTWITLGGAYPRTELTKNDRERYLTFMHKLDVCPAYVRWHDREQFATALQIIDDMKAVHDADPDEIIVRLNYNMRAGMTERPERKGRPAKVKVRG